MKLLSRMSRLIAAATLIAGSPGSLYAAAALAPTPAGQGSLSAAGLGRAYGLSGVPLYFEKNKGQTDAAVKFTARTANYNLYLTSTEAVIVLPAQKGAKTKKPVAVRMKLKGSNAKAVFHGRNILPGHTSYMFGSDRSKWQIGVEQYAKVKLAQVYPGIDLLYYGKKGNVEHDFIVAPGANPGRILMGFEGAKSLRLDAAGDLILGVEGGDLTYKAPALYQLVDGKRASISGRYELVGDKHVRFVVGDYIKSLELVIDPELVYSTYLGGSVEDKITGIAVDASRQAYLTGYSVSDPSGVSGFPAATSTFPLAIGPNNGGRDVFVAKLSADGTSLMWLAWLGGALADTAKGIALDNSSASTPNVFITGETASSGIGTSYPVAGPAMQICSTNTGSLAFVTMLSQSGGIPNPVYSTCWGGVSGGLTNTGNGIAVDSTGAAYVTGTTFVNGPLFPLAGGALPPYTTMGSASEGTFVMKINPNGAGGVAYSMFLGTSDTITRGNAIAVDSTFQAWVVGRTDSPTLPATGGHFSSTVIGPSDAYVAQVNAAGTSLLYATYINGNSNDEATAVKLNNGGLPGYHVFVAGWTVSSTDFPSTAYLLLPTAGPGSRPLVYQKTLVGADDPFILRINPAAVGIQEMVYATHLGATAADRAYALSLDDGDNAYIAGWTESSDWTLAADPVTPGANGINVTGATTQNTSGGRDAFVAAINSAGQFQPFFSYLGATPPGQEATALVVDNLRNIYAAGFTGSAIFPLVTGSLSDGSVPAKAINRTAIAGAFDGFVTKISPVALLAGAAPAFCTLTPAPTNSYAAGGTTITISGTSFNGLVGPSAVTFDGIDAQSYSVNSSSTVITAVAPRHPLVGALTLGNVPLVVTNNAGTCQSNFAYVRSPTTDTGSCGDDFFFPSPATGSMGNFAYCMEHDGRVEIRVYNAIGDLASKIEDSKAAGGQQSNVNTARLAPGVYFYLLEKHYVGGQTFRSGMKKFVVKH